MHLSSPPPLTCKEGRNPSLFDDDEEPDHEDGSEEGSEGNGEEPMQTSPSNYELREFLSRSNSDLESEEAWATLEALADTDLMSEGAGPPAPPPPKADSSKISKEAVHALLEAVKAKMGNANLCRSEINQDRLSDPVLTSGIKQVYRKCMEMSLKCLDLPTSGSVLLPCHHH